MIWYEHTVRIHKPSHTCALVYVCSLIPMEAFQCFPKFYCKTLKNMGRPGYEPIIVAFLLTLVHCSSRLWSPSPAPSAELRCPALRRPTPHWLPSATTW